jgi:hypothetical protein
VTFQTIRCAWCSVDLDDAVAARKHVTSECPMSPSAKLRRAVDALKGHPCVTGDCRHVPEQGDPCESHLLAAIGDLP